MQHEAVTQLDPRSVIAAPVALDGNTVEFR